MISIAVLLILIMLGNKLVSVFCSLKAQRDRNSAKKSVDNQKWTFAPIDILQISIFCVTTKMSNGFIFFYWLHDMCSSYNTCVFWNHRYNLWIDPYTPNSVHLSQAALGTRSGRGNKRICLYTNGMFDRITDAGVCTCCCCGCRCWWRLIRIAHDVPLSLSGSIPLYENTFPLYFSRYESATSNSRRKIKMLIIWQMWVCRWQQQHQR